MGSVKTHEQLSASMSESSSASGGRVDIIPRLSKASLDILGLAAFDFDFGALAGKDKTLVDALEEGL